MTKAQISKNEVSGKELAKWLVGRTITKVDYTDGNVLALTLDDKTVLMCYTELISKGVMQ
jgi:hypothetical protein